MTGIRVTQASISASSLANLQASLARGAKLQEQMTSGKVINRPSDSPTGTVSALALRSQIEVNEQYGRNATDGQAWLGVVDSTLQQVNSRLQRVRELAVRGASTGGLDANSRQAIATEVQSLRDELLGLANTTYSGRPVFGGTTASPLAFDAAGYGYLGDSGQVLRRLDSRTSIDVAASGQQVFGNGATSVFALLDDIAAHVVASNGTALAADMTRLDTRMDGVLQAVTDVGVRYNRAESAVQNATERGLALRSTLSGVEDIDLPKTLMDLKLQDVAYQAALAASAQVIQPSLMDFLR